MAFGCLTHLVSTEYMSIKKSKGDILLFRRNRRGSARHNIDEEVNGIRESLKAPKERSYSFIRKYGEGTFKPLAKNDTTIAQQSSTVAMFWDNLTYVIKIKNDTRKLLSDLEGWVLPRTMTALMVSCLPNKELCSDVE